MTIRGRGVYSELSSVKGKTPRSFARARAPENHATAATRSLAWARTRCAIRHPEEWPVT